MKKKKRSGSVIVPVEPGLVGATQGLGGHGRLISTVGTGLPAIPFSSPSYPVSSDLDAKSSGFAGHSQRYEAIGWGQCTQLLPVGHEFSA